MVEDLSLIRDYNILKNRKIIVCGSKDYVRKASRLLVRVGIFIEEIYCDETILDEELRKIKKSPLTDVYALREKEKYNIIFAEKDQEVFNRELVKLDGDSKGHIYTYCGLYIALAINALKEVKISDVMTCMNDLNVAMGTYDFAAKWLRGIRWAEESGNNILLYAMPKTGTQSMKATLNKYGVEHTYVHFLNLFTPLDKQFYSYYGGQISCLAEMLQDPDYVRSRYLNKIKGKKLKIITSVREPIARNYSMIFQAIKNWGPYPLVHGSNGDFEQGIINWLDYCSDSTWKWFDNEIKEVFGIDVYQYPFDMKKGYTTIIENGVELFLYRLESSRHIGKALGEFLGLEMDLDLLVCHETDKAEYRFIYNQLRNELHVPTEMLAKNYDNHWMKHFYTEKEIEGFKKKWGATCVHVI